MAKKNRSERWKMQQARLAQKQEAAFIRMAETFSQHHKMGTELIRAEIDPIVRRKQYRGEMSM